MKKLGRVEETYLIEKAVSGDQKACDTLILQYETLLRVQAQNFVKKMPMWCLDDAYQEVSVGFYSAVETFDPNLGFKFITHAMNKIKYHLGNIAKTALCDKRKLQCQETYSLDASHDDELTLSDVIADPANVDTQRHVAISCFIEGEFNGTEKQILTDISIGLKSTAILARRHQRSVPRMRQIRDGIKQKLTNTVAL